MEVEKAIEGTTVLSTEDDMPIGATVSANAADRESAVLGMEQWEAVRERRAVGGTVSGIARELGIDRKTVRRCLRDER